MQMKMRERAMGPRFYQKKRLLVKFVNVMHRPRSAGAKLPSRRPSLQCARMLTKDFLHVDCH